MNNLSIGNYCFKSTYNINKAYKDIYIKFNNCSSSKPGQSNTNKCKQRFIMTTECRDVVKNKQLTLEPQYGETVQPYSVEIDVYQSPVRNVRGTFNKRSDNPAKSKQ